MIFTEKLQILRKMIKFDLFSVYILENIKFSTERPYRLVPLPEKLCIFHCSIEELQFSRKIMKTTDFNEIGQNYQVFQ